MEGEGGAGGGRSEREEKKAGTSSEGGGKTTWTFPFLLWDALAGVLQTVVIGRWDGGGSHEEKEGLCTLYPPVYSQGRDGHMAAYIVQPALNLPPYCGAGTSILELARMATTTMAAPSFDAGISRLCYFPAGADAQLCICRPYRIAYLQACDAGFIFLPATLNTHGDGGMMGEGYCTEQRCLPIFQRQRAAISDIWDLRQRGIG